MQGRDDGQREIYDVDAVVGHLLPPGSVFAFLAAHRRELFPDEAFADLFASQNGRPSLPVDVIASVMVLQTLHNLSDREAAEALTYDLRWKAACGFALTEVSFHPTVLVYWRKRLAASDRPHRIFEAVTEVIAKSGALTGRKRRALDSTILEDAVARQDTVTQLIAQIRRVGREIPGADVTVAGLPGHDYAQPGKPDIAWDDRDARDELVSRLVTDALALLASINVHILTKKQQETVALLALVAGQDVEPADGSDGTDGRWKIARKVAPNRGDFHRRSRCPPCAQKPAEERPKVINTSLAASLFRPSACRYLFRQFALANSPRAVALFWAEGWRHAARAPAPVHILGRDVDGSHAHERHLHAAILHGLRRQPGSNGTSRPAPTRANQDVGNARREDDLPRERPGEWALFGKRCDFGSGIRRLNGDAVARGMDWGPHSPIACPGRRPADISSPIGRHPENNMAGLASGCVVGNVACSSRFAGLVHLWRYARGRTSMVTIVASTVIEST
ncbi:transposase [Cryobacterium frigoriphilum]|uniref:Transposase n=1 Tax=Cryobacterium frigoriphilum TaxID=1259150 RepID=A0A4R9A032_9MICO|nr:transposase [Cryobacterium frigoriphilum]